MAQFWDGLGQLGDIVLRDLQTYFTDDVLDLLVVETNRYAEQYRQRNVVPPHSPVNTWTPTEKNEMLVFLGLMGIVYKP